MTATVIAIDGPAGSGKSTLARGLSAELQLPYINTGLMYRSLTQRALASGIDVADAEALVGLVSSIEFTVGGQPPGTLLIDGVEPGDELTTPEVEANVSAVARHLEVREVMRRLQRALGEDGAVMEGRDIGSVVFPDATVKFFLLASEEERAARRVEERAMADAATEGLAEALAERDALDSRVNPLVPVDDAVVIDNTGRSIPEVLNEALGVVRERS